MQAMTLTLLGEAGGGAPASVGVAGVRTDVGGVAEGTAAGDGEEEGGGSTATTRAALLWSRERGAVS